MVKRRGAGRKRRTRKTKTRQRRKVILIITEGEKTEPQYFKHIGRITDDISDNIAIKVEAGFSSAPRDVLKKATYLDKTKKQVEKGDEVWLVIDRDTWKPEDIDEVFNECRDRGYHLAVSNPKFEFWLVLHFADGCGIGTSSECDIELRKHLPNYRKGDIEIAKLVPNIPTAIDNAKRRDDPPTPDWPKDPGCTTVYRLVEKLLPPSQPGS